jgi:hypothetical protein
MRGGRYVGVRPLGGSVGCLAMLLISVLGSIVLSVALTILVNGLS